MAGRQQTSADDVFINCPFDHDYAPTFGGLIFTIYACGFRPRSARELDDGGQTRIDKLFVLIDECRFGIHDLSRTELDEINQLPRFNMPLELGIFLGAKRHGGAVQKAKLPQFNAAQRFLSGTPDWWKALNVSTPGHAGTAVGRSKSDSSDGRSAQ